MRALDPKAGSSLKVHDNPIDKGIHPTRDRVWQMIAGKILGNRLEVCNDSAGAT